MVTLSMACLCVVSRWIEAHTPLIIGTLFGCGLLFALWRFLIHRFPTDQYRIVESPDGFVVQRRSMGSWRLFISRYETGFGLTHTTGSAYYGGHFTSQANAEERLKDYLTEQARIKSVNANPTIKIIEVK